MSYNPEEFVLKINGQVITGWAEDNPVTITRDESVEHKPLKKIKTKVLKIHYDVIGAGPVGHPQTIFLKICNQQGWEYLSGEGQYKGDCWLFEVKEYDTSNSYYLPSYITVR